MHPNTVERLFIAVNNKISRIEDENAALRKMIVAMNERVKDLENDRYYRPIDPPRLFDIEDD